MEVKCPKCRLRYDTPTSAGMTEIACVCPRCGTPFHFTAEDVTQTHDAVEEEKTHRKEDDSRQQQPQQDIRQKPASTPHPPITITPRPVQQRREKNTNNSLFKGCLRWTFIIFIGLFIIAVFAIRNCLGGRSYNQTVLDNGVTQSLDEFGDASVVNDFEGFIVENAEPTPQWLQGIWRAETPQGVVSIIIRGKQIAEESGNEISRGVFYYKKNRIYCKFRGYEEVEIRHVSTKRQCIVYDDIDMEKQ